MNEILGRLVEFPTLTSDQETNREALSYVDEYLAARGMFVTYLDSGGYRTLIATTRRNAKDSPVMIASHMDVVSVTSPDEFIPRKVGDRLYGRGMLDMKFNIETSMSIVDDLANEGSLGNYDFSIVITTDEEIGGYNGTEHVLKSGYTPKVCILPDGGDNWQMQVSSKGYAHYNVAILDGRTAHSRAPWEGNNAIDRLIATWGDIQTLFPKKTEMGPDTNSVSLNIFEGGKVPNQVPDKANMTLDTRYYSVEEMRRLHRAIGQLCVKHGAVLETLTDGVPANFDLKGKYLAPFAKLIQQETGIVVIGSKTLGSSDARFFAKEEIPVISLYPTGGGHHSDGEWISESALHQYKVVVRRYLDEMARTPTIVAS
jgi:acetylornithine deacetylase/succinyl-diaminopimelate desuccinylase-like protein